MQRMIHALCLSGALALSATLAMAATAPAKSVTAKDSKAAPKPILYDANRQQVRTAPKESAGPAIR